jgi:hypothetical protein
MTKSRRSSGGLRYSEEDFKAITARVRGATVTASGSGYTEAVNKAISPKPKEPTFDIAFDETPKKKIKKPNPPNQPLGNPKSKEKNTEDPDWTAPRTVTVRRKGGTSINLHVADVIDSIKQSTIHTSASENHLSIIFDGARILTLNEILAILPYQPYLVFNYKKAWKNRVDDALLLAKDSFKQKLPEFTDSCLFIGHRQSTKLVDRDGLASCFKYILDDLRGQIVLKEKILKDDNPNLIFDTPCFQSTGPFKIGIRLERVIGWSEPVINDKILLSQDPVYKIIKS